MAGFPANKFYNGSTKQQFMWFKKKAKREKLAEEFSKRPLFPKNNRSPFSQNPVWKWFPRQQKALEFAEHLRKKTNPDACLFAYETENGKRKFLVTTHKDFWEKYKAIAANKRHYYEVIQENSPCRLYFDLEFSKEANPGLTGTEVLNIFIRTVCFYLEKVFFLVVDRTSIIDLDSSTDSKFSRHLIFHLPEAVFENNIHCGKFVKQIYEDIAQQFEGENLICHINGCKQESEMTAVPCLPPSGKENSDSSLSQEINKTLKNKIPEKSELRKMIVKSVNGDTTFFCDLGVYTKNRNFRVYLSTKVGKNAPLVLSAENSFSDLPFVVRKAKKHFDYDYHLFLNTLVCGMDMKFCNGNVKFLTFEGTAGKMRLGVGRNFYQCLGEYC